MAFVAKPARRARELGETEIVVDRESGEGEVGVRELGLRIAVGEIPLRELNVGELVEPLALVEQEPRDRQAVPDVAVDVHAAHEVGGIVFAPRAAIWKVDEALVHAA